MGTWADSIKFMKSKVFRNLLKNENYEIKKSQTVQTISVQSLDDLNEKTDELDSVGILFSEDITINEVTIPKYSRGMVSGIQDKSFSVVDVEGNTYTSYRNNGVWVKPQIIKQNRRILATYSNNNEIVENQENSFFIHAGDFTKKFLVVELTATTSEGDFDSNDRKFRTFPFMKVAEFEINETNFQIEIVRDGDSSKIFISANSTAYTDIKWYINAVYEEI